MSFIDRVAFEGMKVEMRMDKEARGWGRKGPPDGATGVLVCRTRHKEYVGRFGHDRYFSEPGVYERDGTWVIRMDDPSHGTAEFNGIKTSLHIGSSDFEVHPDSRQEYDRRAEELWHIPVNREKTIGFHAQQCVLDNRVRLSELPVTEAWELDTVIPDEALGDDLKDYRFVVSRIDYHRFDFIYYDVDAFDADGKKCFSTGFRANQIKEVVRGNLWKREHGETMTFASIEEEAALARGLGQFKEVTNPESGLYSWTLDQCLAAVKNDLVDCMALGNLPFSSGRRINAYRFEDRDLGERLRQHTLIGFDRLPTAA